MTHITVHSANEVSIHDEPGLLARLLGRRRRDYAAFHVAGEWVGPDNRYLPGGLQDKIERAVTRWHARQLIDSLSKR